MLKRESNNISFQFNKHSHIYKFLSPQMNLVEIEKAYFGNFKLINLEYKLLLNAFKLYYSETYARLNEFVLDYFIGKLGSLLLIVIIMMILLLFSILFISRRTRLSTTTTTRTTASITAIDQYCHFSGLVIVDVLTIIICIMTTTMHALLTFIHHDCRWRCCLSS